MHSVWSLLCWWLIGRYPTSASYYLARYAIYSNTFLGHIPLLLLVLPPPVARTEQQARWRYFGTCTNGSSLGGLGLAHQEDLFVEYTNTAADFAANSEREVALASFTFTPPELLTALVPMIHSIPPTNTIVQDGPTLKLCVWTRCIGICQ